MIAAVHNRHGDNQRPPGLLCLWQCLPHMPKGGSGHRFRPAFEGVKAVSCLAASQVTEARAGLIARLAVFGARLTRLILTRAEAQRARTGVTPTGSSICTGVAVICAWLTQALVREAVASSTASFVAHPLLAAGAAVCGAGDALAIRCQVLARHALLQTVRSGIKAPMTVETC